MRGACVSKYERCFSRATKVDATCPGDEWSRGISLQQAAAMIRGDHSALSRAKLVALKYYTARDAGRDDRARCR